MRAVMIRGLGFLGFWVVLIGPDPVDLVAGLVTAAAATWASLYLLPRHDGRWRYTALARLAWRFIQQSISGGWDVARRALDPRLPLRPGFIAYPARLSPGPARNVFCAFTSASSDLYLREFIAALRSRVMIGRKNCGRTTYIFG